MPRSTSGGSVQKSVSKHPNQSSVVLDNRHTQYPVIAKVCKLLGWRISSEAQQNDVVPSLDPVVSQSNGSAPVSPNSRDATEWFVYWSDSGSGIDRLVRSARCYQKINHFPGMVNIYRKSHLARAMIRMQKVSPAEYDFFPRTWILPYEAGDVAKYLDGGKDRCVIIKPSGGAQGKGIYLTMSSKGVKPDEDAVAQVYISRPLLIDGLKFDLRIYVLVTSVDPLRILIYREGLVRLCTTPYRSPDPSNVACTYMHLTNYSVNKHNPIFQQPAFAENGPGRATEEQSSKRSLGWLWNWLGNKGMDSEGVWRDISDIIVKTLISIQATLAQSYRSCKVDSSAHSPFTCFEVLGFDIMITDNLKPCLVEVNHMPSFRTDSALDSRVKVGLIENTLRLLNVSPEDKVKFQTRSALMSQIRLYGSTFSGKGKKAPKLETVAEMWTKYEKNEAKVLGNFQLIYPTTVYPNQVTSGKQALYQGLLAKSHQSLGSAAVSADETAAGMMIIEECYSRETTENDAQDTITNEKVFGESQSQYDDSPALTPTSASTARDVSRTSSTLSSDTITQAPPEHCKILLDQQEVDSLAKRVKAVLKSLPEISSSSSLSLSSKKTKGKKRKKKSRRFNGILRVGENEIMDNGFCAQHTEDTFKIGDAHIVEVANVTTPDELLSEKKVGKDELEQVEPNNCDRGLEVRKDDVESNPIQLPSQLVEETGNSGIDKEDYVRYLPHDAPPPLPSSIPFVLMESDKVSSNAYPQLQVSLHSEAEKQMERLREKYSFLKHQWLDQYQSRRFQR